MNKLNKTLVIICLILVSSITISLSFISLNNNVYADSVEETYIYTMNNIIMPIGLTTVAQYNIWFNAFLSIDIKIDLSNQRVYFINPKLNFAYTEINIHDNDYATTIARAKNGSLLDAKLNFTLTNSNYIDFKDIPTEYQYYIYRFTAKIEYNDINGNNVVCYTKFPMIFSNGVIKNINKTRINSVVYDESNDYGLFNFISYYDDNNNILDIGFTAFEISSDNFPLKSYNFDTNKVAASQLSDYNAIKYNDRTYYFAQITQNDINQESYDIGYKNGYNTGELDGYQNGFDVGNDSGYKIGFQQGKQEGIASKGENVWSNANEFIKNIFIGIFDILSIELLPNISLGTFVVIPLIFSVLFFIVKVAKGGGN